MPPVILVKGTHETQERVKEARKCDDGALKRLLAKEFRDCVKVTLMSRWRDTCPRIAVNKKAS